MEDVTMPVRPPSPEAGKVFFNDRRDTDLLHFGWIFQSDSVESGQITSFQAPPGLQKINVEADHLPEGDVNNYVVFDPGVAESQTVTGLGKETADRESQLRNEGWQVVDANIGRRIFMRKKPQV